MSRIEQQSRQWSSGSGTSPLRRLFSIVGRLAAGVVILFAVVLAGFVLVVRSRDQRSLNRIRGFNQRFLNPLVLSFAGRTGSGGYAILRHVGRRSGRPYATPVVAQPTVDGFVIALPYGSEVDWLLNVQAAGHCEILRNGVTYACGNPELIDQDAALLQIPERVRGAWRFFGIQQFLKLKAESPVPAAELPTT